MSSENIECSFCQNKFEHTTIEKYKFWELQLAKNQYYLGRCIVKLDRHVVDVTELEQDERTELFERILPSLKESIDHLFSPDLYNHSFLGNGCRHLHLHFIPRYKSSREFQGITFQDENWNQHFIPYPEDYEIPNHTFENLKNQISNSMNVK